MPRSKKKSAAIDVARRNTYRVLAALVATFMGLSVFELYELIRLDKKIGTMESVVDELEVKRILLEVTVRRHELSLAECLEVSQGVESPVLGHPVLEIEINVVPSKGAYPDKGTISGSITGDADLQDYGIVIYSHTDNWYIQPSIDASVTRIENGKWENSIYLGSEYLVLLVHETYDPVPVITRVPGPDDRIIDAEIFPGRP